MKKAIIAAIIIASAASFAFADVGEEAQAQTPAKKVIKEVTLRTDSTDFVVGKVSSVKPADLLTRPRSEIEVVDSKGNQNAFIVKSLAVIYDLNGRFLTLNSVQPGQEVQVNYIKKSDNTREAVAIRILK